MGARVPHRHRHRAAPRAGTAGHGHRRAQPGTDTAGQGHSRAGAQLGTAGTGGHRRTRTAPGSAAAPRTAAAAPRTAPVTASPGPGSAAARCSPLQLRCGPSRSVPSAGSARPLPARNVPVPAPRGSRGSRPRLPGRTGIRSRCRRSSSPRSRQGGDPAAGRRREEEGPGAAPAVRRTRFTCGSLTGGASDAPAPPPRVRRRCSARALRARRAELGSRR